MTQDDIINAAFAVWGQDLYRSTSLSKLAKNLGVTKPALYRHFSGKTGLLKAMDLRFLRDYTLWYKPQLETIRSLENWQDRLLFMTRAITGYFARHFDHLIYFLVRAHGNKRRYIFNMKEVEKPDLYFSEFVQVMPADRQYPSVLFMAVISAIFETTLFHKQRRGGAESSLCPPPSDEDLLVLTNAAAEKVRRGLDFEKGTVNSLPYEKLEALGQPGRGEFPPGDPLLAAVAEAVAEAGPWNVSMETAAKYSGLSKSGLYAHFKSREDMFTRLVMTEFERIAAIAAARSGLSKKREERLYLAILSIADYLTVRPEILIILDWVRIQRLKLKLFVPAALHDFFSSLNLRAPGFENNRENISQWILFLLVTILMRRLRSQSGESPDPMDLGCGCMADKEASADPSGGTAGANPAIMTESAGKSEAPPAAGTDDKPFRKFYRFITLGLEGW
ncbi:MAG: TetR/AcrR family transcriptional regulator [Spirochaetaceae bacterium]|jgi:AcrR family transcriptional regulator|nr:TetR/AcrR family transcriptional regulator [Spirochaetaceae bacterium]